MAPAQPELQGEPFAPAHDHRRAQLGSQDGTQRIGRLRGDAEIERAGARFREGVLRGRVGLQPGEGRDEGAVVAAEIEAVAALDLAKELVGARRALGRPRSEPGNGDVAPHLIGAVGVAQQGVGVDLAFVVVGVEAGLEGV